MTQLNANQSPFDDRLGKYLALLEPTPPRDPKAAERTRAKYEADVDAYLEVQEGAAPAWTAWLSGLIKPFTGWQNLALARLAAVFILAVLLFGSAGATAYAAQGALPGDTLFAVKTGLEDVQIRLAGRPEQQAALHLAFASRRLDEALVLIAAGRQDDLGLVSDDFEAHLAGAWQARIETEVDDPAAAAELDREIQEERARYEELMGGRSDDGDQAEPVSNDNQGNDNSGGDNQGNDNGGNDDQENDNNGSSGGNDNANENDMPGGGDNTNDNESSDDTLNDNAGDDNLNDNSDDNDNLDDNTNDNADDNTNDNADDNTNDNVDDNTNDNVDDNTNDNVDENDNTDDNTDDSNDNDNTSTDGNDNVDESNDNDNEETSDDNDNEDTDGG